MSAAALVAGCSDPSRDVVPSPAQPLDGGNATAFEALPGVGVAPYRAIVRATNRFGASVEVSAVDVTVDSQPLSVAVDGFGYGGISIGAPGSVVVQPSGGTAAEVHAIQDKGWPGLGFHPAYPAPGEGVVEMVQVSTGLVGRVGPDLVWAGAGAPPHRVLHADADLLGVRAVNVDVDGVLDLVAWTSTTVFLLRGSGNGGFGWGGGFQATGLTVGGADVADLSGDNLPDVAIGWANDAGTGVIDIWEGDGLFEFTAAEPRNVAGRPVAVDVADATSEGTPQITMLLDGGGWSRFVWGAEQQYMPVGPFYPESVAVDRSAGFVPLGDINADAADEIAIADALVPGQPRDLWLVDIAIEEQNCRLGDPNAQCITEFTQVETGPGGQAAGGDADGDDFEDLWVLAEDRVLELYSADSDLGRGVLQHVTVGTLPTYGPLSTADLDGDRVVDLSVAGPDVWWQWYGRVTSQDLLWVPREQGTVFVRENLDPWYEQVELDGDDTTLEFVGTNDENGDTFFKTLQYTIGGGRAPNLGNLEIENTGLAPTDLAVCGRDAYVAIGGHVLRIDLTDPARPTLAAGNGQNATRVDCGPGPGGSAVAVLEGSAVVLRDRGLAEKSRVNAPGAVDVELLDLGGATEEVVTCDTPACGIAAWSPNGGDALPVIGDETSLRLLLGPGDEQPLGGAGRPWVVDLDDDGHEDIVGLTTDGLATLHRSTGEGLGGAELSHTPLRIRGQVLFVDGDGDGWRDLFVIDGDDRLVFTVLPVDGSTTGPSDTSDTGSL